MSRIFASAPSLDSHSTHRRCLGHHISPHPTPLATAESVFSKQAGPLECRCATGCDWPSAWSDSVASREDPNKQVHAVCQRPTYTDAMGRHQGFSCPDMPTDLMRFGGVVRTPGDALVFETSRQRYSRGTTHPFSHDRCRVTRRTFSEGPAS